MANHLPGAKGLWGEGAGYTPRAEVRVREVLGMGERVRAFSRGVQARLATLLGGPAPTPRGWAEEVGLEGKETGRLLSLSSHNGTW